MDEVFISPLALIFVSGDGRILDLTEVEEFYDNLHVFLKNNGKHPQRTNYFRGTTFTLQRKRARGY